MGLTPLLAHAAWRVAVGRPSERARVAWPAAPPATQGTAAIPQHARQLTRAEQVGIQLLMDLFLAIEAARTAAGMAMDKIWTMSSPQFGAEDTALTASADSCR